MIKVLRIKIVSVGTYNRNLGLNAQKPVGFKRNYFSEITFRSDSTSLLIWAIGSWYEDYGMVCPKTQSISH